MCIRTNGSWTHRVMPDTFALCTDIKAIYGSVIAVYMGKRVTTPHPPKCYSVPDRTEVV